MSRTTAALAALFLSALVIAPDALAQARSGSGRPDQGTSRRQEPRRKGPAPGSTMPADKPAAGGGSTTAAPTEAPKGELLDRIVAVVNEGVVTASELQARMDEVIKGLRDQKRQLPPDAELRKQLQAPVLNDLVMRELQLQLADRAGMKVSDEQLNDAMAQLAENNKLTLAQLPAAMRAAGLDYASERENARKEILIQRLRQKEVLQKINITPREVEQYTERLKKLPFGDDEYNVSHILIALPEESSRAQHEAAEKTAREVYEKTATEDFAQLALKYSDAQTRLQGGSLGWMKGTDLPTWSLEVIAGLKPGEVSKPFNAAPLGWMIVKLNEIRHATEPVKDQVHVRHILMKPNTLQDDGTVKLKLSGIRQRILNGEDFGAFAATMSADTNSAVDGGEIDWISPDEFDPAFAKVVAGLKENEISEPFQSSYGWHIVQLLGRRQFDTTEDELRMRAIVQLRDAKANQEGELWLRQMRDQAYIDTNL
jgi:peptidyl-prolyl cis-trans isomerase SurA